MTNLVFDTPEIKSEIRNFCLTVRPKREKNESNFICKVIYLVHINYMNHIIKFCKPFTTASYTEYDINKHFNFHNKTYLALCLTKMTVSASSLPEGFHKISKRYNERLTRFCSRNKFQNLFIVKRNLVTGEHFC